MRNPLYFVTRSENLIQTTISLLEDYLMLTYFDSDTSDYDTIITKEILPTIAVKIIEQQS